jgi:hypothetical protein
MLHTYSQRSQQRDQAIDAFTERTGRQPTDNEVAILVRESRPDKLTEISTAEVKERQRVRLTPDERQTLTELRQRAVNAAEERAPLGFERAAPALRHGEQHLFERRSVVKDHDVLAEALRHGRGAIALADAKGALRLQESSGAILRVGHEVATRASLDREQHMIVDEAGMVSARQMTALLDLAERQAARLVFSGDTRQLQSVEAGDALRILEAGVRVAQCLPHPSPASDLGDVPTGDRSAAGTADAWV